MDVPGFSTGGRYIYYREERLSASIIESFGFDGLYLALLRLLNQQIFKICVSERIKDMNPDELKQFIYAVEEMRRYQVSCCGALIVSQERLL